MLTEREAVALMSRPTRAAWIETIIDMDGYVGVVVAAHTGRVD